MTIAWFNIMVFRTVCTLCLFSIQLSSVLSQGTLPDRSPTQQYPFTTDLDEAGEYVLRWGFNDTFIWFEVQVRTLGYVGFGISESKKMVPADVMVAYVANYTVHIRDYHTVGYFSPVSDVTQDWFVDYGYEENGWTVLGFHRLLDTCDTLGDRAITTDTMRLIYSYSASDPVNLDSIMYHRSKRGSKSVPLLTSSPPPEYLPAGSQTMDFLNNNISPLISEATEHNVDHMVLYRCHVSAPQVLLKAGESFNCFTDAPDHVQFCREHVASFGHGKSDLYMPEDVGIPYGGQGEANVYVLATHYENQDFTQNLIDNSGIRITYTSQLRANDAAFLSMGNIISPNWAQFIPPGDQNFVQKAYCSMRCLAWGLGDCRNQATSVPMTVVGVQFHAHALSKTMKLRHMTYEKQNIARENAWLAKDDTFDHDQQSFRLLKNRQTVACRDELLLECSYTSTQRTRPTIGGWSEYDELCRAYVLYYPRKPIEGCMSWSNYDQLANSQGQRVNGSDVFRTLVTTDWSNNMRMRQNLKYALRHSMGNAQCWSSSPSRSVSYAIDYFKQPFILKKYKEPPKTTC